MNVDVLISGGTHRCVLPCPSYLPFLLSTSTGGDERGRHRRRKTDADTPRAIAALKRSNPTVGSSSTPVPQPVLSHRTGPLYLPRPHRPLPQEATAKARAALALRARRARGRRARGKRRFSRGRNGGTTSRMEGRMERGRRRDRHRALRCWIFRGTWSLRAFSPPLLLSFPLDCYGNQG